MIVSINQPAYLPWLGYFDRIEKSDLHIILDNVQIERNTKTSFTNRNTIRTNQDSCWLTVPIKKATDDESKLINKTLIDGRKWTKKHLRSIEQSYCKAKYFNEYIDWFKELYDKEWIYLSSLLNESTSHLLNVLSINTPLIFSSSLDINSGKSQLVLDLCTKVGATKYLSGPFGRGYLNEQGFKSAGVEIEYHDYVHPEYTQCYPGFLKNMSTIDLLFNHGNDSLSILANK